MKAPIVIFTYNRLDHAKKTINALKKNRLANKSSLIIYSDGPKNNVDLEKIKNIREYLKTIKGFKSLNIIENNINKGLSESIIIGVSKILKQYGKIIVIEDDIVVSPYFLDYMNEALDLYEDEEDVVSIHGYIYPVKNKLPDTFFLKGADCWGWATWKRGWDLFEEDGKRLYNQLVKSGRSKEFDFNNTYPYLKMLKDQVEGNNNSWAIRWYASAFLKNKLTLYPGNTFCQNIGLDSSGIHCGINTEYYHEGFVMNYKGIKKIKIKENIKERKKIIKFFSKKSNIVSRIKNKLLKKKSKKQLYGWFGKYNNWNEVSELCTGYDTDLILEKCKNSLLKVKNDEAVYERDSFLFDHIEYSWPLLSGLLLAAAQNDGKINILDFGGSLGSSYYQNRKFLDMIKVKWNIIEQKQFVNCGKKYFEDKKLFFYETIDQCLEENNINVVVLSSVLQYLEKPYDMLNEIISKKVDYIIIDRTAFTKNEKFISLQKIPPEIYEASYPSWFFNENEFKNKFKEYNIIETFFDKFSPENYNINDTPVYWKGFILKRK